MAAPTRWSGSDEELHALLQGWHDRGLLDDYEIARIEAAELHGRHALPEFAPPGAPQAALVAAPVAPPEAPRHGGPTVAEALGYAGAALIAGATIVLVSQFWHDLATAGRVTLLGAAAGLLLAAGLLMPERRGAPAHRLQAVLWTGSVGLAVSAWTLALTDGAGWAVEDALLAGFAFGAIEAGLLWWRAPSPLLHLATFVTLAGVVGNVVGHADWLGDATIGVGLWLFAVAWLGLTLLDRLPPRWMGMLAASVLMTSGAVSTTVTHWGSVFALATMAAILALAVWQDNLAVLAVGAVGTFIVVMNAAHTFVGGPSGTAVGLLVAGVVLVLCALRIVRHGWRKPHSPR